MRYSFTGPARDLGPDEKLYVMLAVGALSTRATEFHSGAAFGVDTAAAWAAALFFPHAEHHVWVPNGPHNEDIVMLFQAAGHHVHLPEPDTDYMDRNDLLVAACDVLVAFPETNVEVLRSGTWATIRRAWKASKEVKRFPLDAVG